jgi:hypothetical protein
MAPVSGGARTFAIYPEFRDALAVIVAGSRSRAQMERVSHYTVLIGHTEAHLIGLDTPMKDGDFGGEEA